MRPDVMRALVWQRGANKVLPQSLSDCSAKSSSQLKAAYPKRQGLGYRIQGLGFRV